MRAIFCTQDLFLEFSFGKKQIEFQMNKEFFIFSRAVVCSLTGNILGVEISRQTTCI